MVARVDLDGGDIFIKLSKIHFLLEATSTVSTDWLDGQRRECIQFVNFSWRATSHFWENEPSDHNGYSASGCKAKARIDILAQEERQTASQAPGNKTYKNPVFTPHCVCPPLIINGVQKLNIIATIFESANDQPAV
jgi:hypothetical protein